MIRATWVLAGAVGDSDGDVESGTPRGVKRKTISPLDLAPSLHWIRHFVGSGEDRQGEKTSKAAARAQRTVRDECIGRPPSLLSQPCPRRPGRRNRSPFGTASAVVPTPGAAATLSAGERAILNQEDIMNRIIGLRTAKLAGSRGRGACTGPGGVVVAFRTAGRSLTAVGKATHSTYCANCHGTWTWTARGEISPP